LKKLNIQFDGKMNGEQDDLMVYNSSLIQVDYFNATNNYKDGTKLIKNMKYIVLRVSLFFFFLFILMLLFHFGKLFLFCFVLLLFEFNSYILIKAIKFYKKYKLKKSNKMIKKLGKELIEISIFDYSTTSEILNKKEKQPHKIR
jgi:hypothetical protein